MKTLTPQEQEMLWGEEGPYSEAKLILNTRILDDSVSRVTVEVDGNINPTTFRIVKKHTKHFEHDKVVLDLVASARYEGKGYGYHVSLGYEQLTDDPAVMERARKKLEILKDSIMRMHDFVLKYLADAP